MPNQLFPLDPRKKVRVEIYPAEDHPDGLKSDAYQAWKVAHAKAVRQLASRAADSLKIRVAHHDADKTASPEKVSPSEGASAEVMNDAEEAKLAHKRQSRHHVLDTDLKTDLLDWIEAVADWVATSVAKGGEQWTPEDTPENREKLWKSMMNTIPLMKQAAAPKETPKPKTEGAIPTVEGSSVPVDAALTADEPETAAAVIQEGGSVSSTPEAGSEAPASNASKANIGRKGKAKPEAREVTSDEVDQPTLQSDFVAGAR